MADQNITLQVHPGYGFLLENKSFVEELDKWPSGPTRTPSTLWGDKIESKWMWRQGSTPSLATMGLLRSVHLDLIEDATQPHNW